MLSKQDIQVVLSFFKELPNNPVIEHVKTLTATSYKDEVNEECIFRATKPLQVAYAEFHSQLKEKREQVEESVIWEIKKGIDTILQSLAPKYSKGDNIYKVQGIEKYTFAEDYSFSKDESELQIEQGIVYLINIWDTRCQPCTESMNQSQQMLEKNTEWEGKVKIIGISIDDETEVVPQRVKQMQWISIQHFRFLNGLDKNNPIIWTLHQIGIPFVFLINKLGQINFLGDPSNENLEARINFLISPQYNGEVQNDAPGPQEQITREDFKVLKQQVYIIQTTLKQAEFQGSIGVVLEKVNYWKQDGSKQVHKRSKLILNYDVDVKEEPKLNSFLENYWFKIPQNLRTVGETKIRDPVRQIKEIQFKFQEIYQAFGVNIQYLPIKNIMLSYDSKNNHSNVTKSQKTLVYVNDLSFNQYTSGKQNTRKFLQQYQYELNEEIRQAIRDVTESLQNSVVLAQGKKFQAISNYKKWKSEVYTTIEHTPGQVLILDYWAYWCRPCGRDIRKNTNLLKVNAAKWDKAVRFICLSIVIPENVQQFMERNEETLKYIDFYFPKEQDQPDTILYGVEYIPHYVVVDKFGFIRKIASVENLEILVEQLINEVVPAEQDQNNKANITQDSVDQVLEILQSAETYQKLNSVDKVQIIQLDAQFQQVQDELKGESYFKIPRLQLECRDSQLEVVNLILKKIFELIPENNWEINKTISKTFCVPYPGQICSLCNKDILNEVQQYYSPFKKVHLCVECAEFDDKTKKGSERYKCTDNLIFINGPLADQSVLENIDDHKIGFNLQLKQGEIGPQIHPMICKGCFQNSEGPRYISTSALPGNYRLEGYVDFCQECFQVLKNKQSPEAQDIIQKNVGYGMINDSLLVRILFSHGDYLDF